ncbi:MAG: pseudaminic acid synthase [Alphaproteobacteria bacterium]|nr:pseudaminic acid synthase [Alphaproteobacteria bacterium]
MKEFQIDGRSIGFGHPPYVIAELSGNHNGDLSRALALVDAAAEAGADAVKLQTYTADTITIDHDGPGFTLEGGLWDGRRLYELYQEAATPWEWHEALFERARTHGIAVFSSPFDHTAVDFLEGLGAPAYKIASFEAVDTDLIAKAAATGKPLIISTGMADLSEIAEAVQSAQVPESGGVALLHCVSGYPTPMKDCHLATIGELMQRFDVPIGLSDHSHGTTVPIAATALGACIIEKHFTLNRADGGVDSAFSLEPHELAELVRGTRSAWESIGSPGFGLKPSEAGNRQLRRSLYAVRPIAAGEVFTRDNVRSIRPGYGLPPKRLHDVLGRKAARDIGFGEPMAAEMIHGGLRDDT